MTQDSNADDLLQEICLKLMERPYRVNDLRIAIRIIRDHALKDPDWLPSLPARDRALVEGALLAEAGRNDVVH